ncbi:MAG: beta-eliminating lyase-related protein [Pseudorhodobacter sp.]|nr:beta-eliminating lyase-related protein [Pseudorhodobacter sp.]
MFFASDNGAPIPAKIMEAMTAANQGYAISYGNDPATARLQDQIRQVFEAPMAEVLFLTVGTAANALALSLLTPPWGTVFCHQHAHIAEDECGAPEFYTGGARLSLVNGASGKIDPAALGDAIAATGHSVHNFQRGCLSVTNVTEAGTVYSVAEIEALAAIARGANLPVHLDGARLANALAATGASPADMTWRAGVDVLSLGGTKNGLLAAEAVVLFDAEKSAELGLRRKRGGHLNSKLRYVAAQFSAWFDEDYWLTLATQANAMAARLAKGLEAVPGARINHPTEANIVFAQLPLAAHQRAQQAGAQYYGHDTAGNCRLVCSWSTTEADVDGLLSAFRG